MTVGLEGRIDIRLSAQDGRVQGVQIASTRPQLAQHLLAGKMPVEAADIVGRVFSLCGKAQKHADQTACEAALGVQVDIPEQLNRQRQILSELALEHAWRLLLSWPQASGEVPDVETLMALRREATNETGLEAVLDDVLRDKILGVAPDELLGNGLDHFEAWCEQGSTLVARLFNTQRFIQTNSSAPALLPSLQAMDDQQLAVLGKKALNEEGFCARPTWQSGCAETGAVARMALHPLMAKWLDRYGHGSGARLLGRLIELGSLSAWPKGQGVQLVRALPLEQNTGLAAVETSRGLLLHVVQLADGKVARYRIVAPTEWNFHPEGALRTALLGLAADEKLEARARHEAMALDPCVEFGLEITHA